MSSKTQVAVVPRKELKKENIHQYQRTERALRSALHLNQFIQTASEDDIIRFCVEEAERLTESKIAFFHLVNTDQETIHLKAWSSKTIKVCDVPGYNSHYPVSKAGIWADCLRFRKPVIHNDYESLPHKKGLPAGHVKLIREVVVPIFERDKIVAMIGVGNKAENYDQTDVDQLQLLTENVWFAIQRGRSEKNRNFLMEQLEQKNEELQSIVYATSHDLRSPIVNLLGFSSELESGCRRLSQILSDHDTSMSLQEEISLVMKTDIMESLGFIIASGRKMDSLLEGLLRISRIGTASLSIMNLQMSQLMNEVVKAMEYQIKQYQVEMLIHPLPDCRADKNQVNQVFSNLIDNAIKYLAPARKGRIEVSGCIQNNEAVYTVEDNGIGIEPRQHKKIFELFFRLPSQNQVDGEGIGLTMIQRILDRNNGRIWVESKPAVGSRFYVALPAVSS
jgi:signal transduction histidine kinase